MSRWDLPAGRRLRGLQRVDHSRLPCPGLATLHQIISQEQDAAELSMLYQSHCMSSAMWAMGHRRERQLTASQRASCCPSKDKSLHTMKATETQSCMLPYAALSVHISWQLSYRHHAGSPGRRDAAVRVPRGARSLGAVHQQAIHQGARRQPRQEAQLEARHAQQVQHTQLRQLQQDPTGAPSG